MLNDTTPASIAADVLRKELIADLREVFNASGKETPQIVRDVIEHADSWLRAYIPEYTDSWLSVYAPDHT